MIPHLFYYQLAVLGLLWLCVIRYCQVNAKIARLCSQERTIGDFGLSRALYFRYSRPLSFPQEEGVWERFAINLTMPHSHVQEEKSCVLLPWAALCVSCA